MDTDETLHLQILIDESKKRLRALEIREAQLGAGCPPEITIEIAGLKAKIADFGEKLSWVGHNKSAPPLQHSVWEPALRPPCPYPGMIPFRAEDARLFYGREDEIQKMLRHLRYNRVLLVIGPSGSTQRVPGASPNPSPRKSCHI